MIPSRITNIPHLLSRPDAIKRQLERVLNSPSFRASRQLSRFLRFVVEESLFGRGDRLNQYAIAVSALRRSKDFDPNTDPVIRIEARRLRQTLALYYQNMGKRDPILIEIPTGHYAAVFRQNLAGADPGPVVQFHRDSWPASAHPQTKTQPKDTRGPTIALLGFNYLSGDQGLAEIAESLTEGLATTLNRFEFITVIRPSAPAGFGNKDLESVLNGVEFQALYVLGGTLRRWGERVQLFSRLSDPLTAELIWSESFPLSDRAPDTYQEQTIQRLAAAVADIHGVTISHWAEKTLRDSATITEQQKAVIGFRHFRNRLDTKAFGNALQACERALESRPDDALANSLLADLGVTDYVNGFGVMDSPLARAEAAACDAVALQPASPLAHFALGKVYFAKSEPGACLAEFERCEELNPCSAFITARVGLYRCLLGDWEGGGQLVTASAALYPDSWPHRFIAALNRYRQGDYEVAWTEARRLHTPELLWDTLMRAACLGQLGRGEEAELELTELLRLCPDFRTKGRERVQRLLFAEENVAMVMEGLGKAGLGNVH